MLEAENQQYTLPPGSHWIPERILDGLDSAQKEAVTHDQGPLLVIAGAGTGKTTVITRRIAYLIAAKKAQPEEILALTFTEKAAAEMEERVDLLVPYGYTGVWIGTFHAFGDRVLRDHALELGLTPDFRVLTRPEQIIFFRERLFEFPLSYYRPLGDPTRYIDAILSLISRAQDEDVSPEEYLAYAKSLEEQFRQDPNNKELVDIAAQQMEIALTYHKYQELKTLEGKIDFGDQVNAVLKLFRNHPAILRRYQERFRYILVDEFQDTNYAQFELVKLLAAIHNNITAVGDDDQSIYKFRGASISNILGFMNIYPQAKQIILTRNYRSPQPILDAAYRLISYNNPDRLEVRNNIDKRLKGLLEKKPSIFYLHFDTLSSEADTVIKIVAEKVASGEYTYRDFAILVRSNNDADPFLRSFNMRRIPYRFTGSQGLYQREEIKLLIAFLKAITNFDDSISLYYLANSEIYRLDSLELTRCMNYAHRKNRNLLEIFQKINQIPELKDISAESKATIAKIVSDIESYVKRAREYSTGQLVYQFITESGYLKRLNQDNYQGDQEKLQNIARFFDLLWRFRNLSLEDHSIQFVKHLDMLVSVGDDPAAVEADLDAEAVNVLTVHKAKGLEFRVVFMVSLVNGRFPWPRRKEPIELPVTLVKEVLPLGDFHLQEERRLFYVGMTRAKEELYLTSARDYGGSRARKVSPFVLEALDLSTTNMEVYKASALEAIHRNAPPSETLSPELKPIPDTSILTLSHYQIDDYLTCPLKYKYVHILRVPILPHHTVIYGKALHDAIQEYHRRKLNGQKISSQELIAIFENCWINEGFLTRKHEEQRLEEGRQVLKRFYAAQEASGVIPTYVEKEFSFWVENNRLIGRWDRVDVRNGETIIIDFKSSQVKQQEEADRRTRQSLQLSIYALAYSRIFGLIPDRVELHFLESGLIGKAVKTPEELQDTETIIREAAAGIRSQRYPAQPEYLACRYCAYRQVCPSAVS